MLYFSGVGALTLAWLKYIEILQKTILIGSLLYHGVTVCLTSYDPERNVRCSFILQVGHPCQTGQRVEDQLALQFAVRQWATLITLSRKTPYFGNWNQSCHCTLALIIIIIIVPLLKIESYGKHKWKSYVLSGTNRTRQWWWQHPKTEDL